MTDSSGAGCNICCWLVAGLNIHWQHQAEGRAVHAGENSEVTIDHVAGGGVPASSPPPPGKRARRKKDQAVVGTAVRVCGHGCRSKHWCGHKCCKIGLDVSEVLEGGGGTRTGLGMSSLGDKMIPRKGMISLAKRPGSPAAIVNAARRPSWQWDRDCSLDPSSEIECLFATEGGKADEVLRRLVRVIVPRHSHRAEGIEYL